MKLIRVDDRNIFLLKDFICQIGKASKNFRYYNNRQIEVVKNHLLTILLMDHSRPIAYGHLDKENDIIWLGICVLPDCQGKGHSKLIMDELIKYSLDNNIERIFLTVDSENLKAICLYEKYNFILLDSANSSLKYVLNFK